MTRWPHNKHMQPDPAMPSLFHCVCQWRGAADARRYAESRVPLSTSRPG
jgi:hypothetical protein